MSSIWLESVPIDTNPFRFFLFVSRPHWKTALAALTFVSIAATLSSSVSYIFKLIANAAAALPHGTSAEDLAFATALCICALFAAKACWRISGFIGASWATGARATARHSLTSYVTLHSRGYFSDRFAGSIANKIGHAANGMVEMIEQILWEFMELIVSALVSFVIAFSASPLIAWIFLVWVCVVTLMNTYFARKRVPLSAAAQQLETGLTGSTVDLLSNISAMQDYARRPFEIGRIEEMIDRRRRAGLRNWHYGERVLVINNILQTLFGGAMAFTAVALAYSGALSGGDVVLVITIVFRIEGLLQALGGNLNKVSNVWGEIEESLNEIVEPHEIPDPADAKKLVVTRGDLSFHAVTFSYAGNQVFKNLTLNIPPGERVGLVGRSGAGKSTLIRLILHHHNLDAGSITIDGNDIAEVTLDSLRNAISIVPQEPLLFHRSVSENIAYGNPEASQREIVKAAKLAQAHEFIERLPGGYKALVGERGVKLSGGERQRIAIARAILKRAPILLLDEATSALDSENEVAIQKALDELMHDKTVIAIAHRLSTLRQMDRILVLERGKIVEEGTHDELVERGGIYADLWNHQAGGFIAAE